MEENTTPVMPSVEEHIKVLEKQMTLLAERHANDKLSESDTALFLALHSSNVLITNLYQKIDLLGDTANTQAETIKTMMDSQKLMIELLQRWHGIDIGVALPKSGEPDHG